MAKYRIVKDHQSPYWFYVERRFLGIWWKVFNYDNITRCEHYINAKLNPTIKEYN